ncbi:DoxX family membrane protein [Kitasatospora sp. MAP5-34]|uniref:DoxX family membrane protein n=1 Tax=Kitasatospora sp. MAP5-34 TaxID=3035102 RepID=UPI0024745A8D|nr:DoxX family membrane protein [Kitasatospora sp. MAP5-34]MDH6576696.1 putative membrane protein YphA (DoxX/SURF4 family) [Kitasatospora sp. MAP5-34]
MDTRTPRRPGQGGTAGIDDDPGLNTVKVPSDPAKLSSTQASFRIRLATPVAPLIGAPAGAAFGDPYGMQSFAARPLLTPQLVVDSAQLPALVGVGALAGAPPLGAPPRRKGRLTTVTWTGQAAPGDLAATQLLEAVRLNTVPAPAGAPGTGAAALAAEDTQQLPTYGQAVPRQSSGPPETGRPAAEGWTPKGELPEVSATAAGDSKHAWYPGRKVDLGLVLLPLRVVLGALSVYAGFSKLCDPVYFDGGDRGSMMRWLGSLHPWRVAQPLLDFAMAHPVGAGLGVAFTQVVVGVLSILGLWQRMAAAAVMALSAALLFTVSWRTVPVYDTPDLIFLAAWSPLLIAGAPFGSLDGRIALEAWRRYGSGAPAAVRRRVLRRGTVVTTVVVGLTMLLGSMLGAAVRTGSLTHSGPAKSPSDYGSPMWPANGASPAPAPTPTPSPSASPSPVPSPTAPSASASSGKSAKPHSSKSDRSTAGASSSSGGDPSTGSSTHSGSSGSGSSTTPKQPSSTGGSPGLIGGVLGSAPLLGLPTPALGMDSEGGRVSGAGTAATI